MTPWVELKPRADANVAEGMARAVTAMLALDLLPPPAVYDRVRGVPPAAPQPVACGRNDPCPCGSGRKYKRCCRRA